MIKRVKVLGVFVLAIACVGAAVAEEPPPLFNGKDLSNWSTEGGDPVPEVWKVADGVIHLNRGEAKGGHIITKHEYGDFDLSFDWKIAEGGNSGLKYRVRKYDGKTLGLEYQILDDPNTKEGQNPDKIKNSAGSLYDIKEPNDKKKLNPTGEYNHARIVVRGNSIQHWMNGELIVSITVGDGEWKERVADSKFKKYEAFSENRHGKIMLTDHGAEVWYKNLKLVPLKAK